MKLKKILQEMMLSDIGSRDATVSFDADDVLRNFKNEVSETTAKLVEKYEDELKRKLDGKIVSIRASKGYGQGQKDYDIRIGGVSISWYDDHYELVLKDNKGSEYFLADGHNIKISNKEDAPVTSAVQNTAQGTDRHHVVKNF